MFLINCTADNFEYTPIGATASLVLVVLGKAIHGPQPDTLAKLHPVQYYQKG